MPQKFHGIKQEDLNLTLKNPISNQMKIANLHRIRILHMMLIQFKLLFFFHDAPAPSGLRPSDYQGFTVTFS